jgi:hypothetical protein
MWRTLRKLTFRQRDISDRSSSWLLAMPQFLAAFRTEMLIAGCMADHQYT